MRKSGWFKDSYRHSLAARGINAGRYYARKKKSEVNLGFQLREDVPTQNPTASSSGQSTEEFLKDRELDYKAASGRRPGTALKREKEEKALREEFESQQVAARPINRALQQVQNGDTTLAIEFLNNPKKYQLSSEQASALKTALNARALALANAGLPVPEDVSQYIDSSVRERVKLIGEKQRKEFESPLKKEIDKDLVKLSGEVLEAPGFGIAQGKAAYDSLDTGGPFAGGGLVSKERDLESSPFVTNNAAVGRKGADGKWDGSNEEDGMLNPLKGLEGTRFRGAWDFLDDGRNSDVNPILAKTPSEMRRATEKVQDQVDSLHKYRDELSAVDLSGFDEGNSAFENGNRESLIASIVKLQAEESKLKDRWNLVGQTWRNVTSLDNQASAFQKDSGSNPVFGLGKNGASRLADQTEKLNRVREELIKSNNKVHDRRRMLEYRLQRLDASVPPESDVPQKITRFEQPRKPFYMDVQNPVTEQFKGER